MPEKSFSLHFWSSYILTQNTSSGQRGLTTVWNTCCCIYYILKVRNCYMLWSHMGLFSWAISKYLLKSHLFWLNCWTTTFSSWGKPWLASNIKGRVVALVHYEQMEKKFLQNQFLVGGFSYCAPDWLVIWWFVLKLSSPLVKRAGPKGLRAESARAVTGRRCPHSGVG